MSAVTEAGSVRVGRPPAEQAAHANGPSILEHVQLARVFGGCVVRYLALVLPLLTRELARTRAAAGAIPDPGLRRAASESLGKRGNIEGAALFATLAPTCHRAATLRALIAFQTAYNYLDALSELPSREPVANAEQLHQALIGALHPGAPHLDYYAHSPAREDGGYLVGVLEACRDALEVLPSYPAVACAARRAAARIVDFQALNLTEDQGGHGALRRWASETTLPGSDLAWWETAAGSGSSLAVHALIATAAQAHVASSRVHEIEQAYFPWIGTLHSLLDSLVDHAEDREEGRRSLLDYYDSPAHAVIHLADLAVQARGAVERLRDAHAHRVIVTAMCSYYLSAPQCQTRHAYALSAQLTEVLGVPLAVAIALFRARRLAATLTDHRYS
jgi:tetraprenyl-beta-curcumene synthase